MLEWPPSVGGGSLPAHNNEPLIRLTSIIGAVVTGVDTLPLLLTDRAPRMVLPPIWTPPVFCEIETEPEIWLPVQVDVLPMVISRLHD